MLGGVVDALRDRKISSRELVEDVLSKIEAQNPTLGAFLAVDAERARALADESDRRRASGNALGALDGVPIGVKDNIAEEGQRLSAASRILDGYKSPYDATVIRKLKASGAVLVGRMNCDEFAMGSSTENSAYGPCVNPWDHKRVPGGSSGGSAAAVAAGILPAALGSDTGGSIRQPAALCGVVGIKPTYGRVSRYGLVAFASSLDVIGPIAADVCGAALVLETIAGPDPRDSTCVSRDVPRLSQAAATPRARGARIGVPRALVEKGLRDDVRAALDKSEDALRAEGATIVDVELPHADKAVAVYYVLATAEASSNLSRYDGVRYGPRRGEGGLLSMYEETRALLGAEVKRRIVLGSWVLSAGYVDAYYRRAQRVRARIAAGFASAFEKCDVILLPTSPEPAWEIGQKMSDPLTMYLADIFTVPASLAGLPAISVNAGFSVEGLPIGVQLIAPAFEEERMISIAAALPTTTKTPEVKA